MYDIIHPGVQFALVEEGASPDLVIARLKCEQRWRADFPSYAQDAQVSWEDGQMYYTYLLPVSNRTATRRCEYQLREVELSTEVELGLYEVFNHRSEEVKVAAVPGNRARWECERAWREGYPSLAQIATLSWRDAVMYYKEPRAEPKKTSLQIRRMNPPKPGNLKSIEYSTIVGKRTYRLDVFGDRMHAAAYALIQEHNRNAEFWLELADRNMAAPDGQDISLTRDMALMAGGKMEGMHHAIDAILRALGML